MRWHVSSGSTRTGVAIFVAIRPYTVIGIFHDVIRRPEAMAAAIVPLPWPAAWTRRPEVNRRPETYSWSPLLVLLSSSDVKRPSHCDPRPRPSYGPWHRQIPVLSAGRSRSSTTRSTLLISGVALLMGTVSIGNAATAGIAARTGEIGLPPSGWRTGDATSSANCSWRPLCWAGRRSDRRSARRAGHLRRVDRQRMGAGHRDPVRPGRLCDQHGRRPAGRARSGSPSGPRTSRAGTSAMNLPRPTAELTCPRKTR